MSEKLNRFIGLMKNIFELDKSDLDFGIYRIMNIRKDEIEKFLSEGLPKKVQETLEPFASNTGEIEKRLAEIKKTCDDVGVDVESSKMAEEYAQLKSQLTAGVDLSALEADVYSALYSFFNRYYDEGDFISKRRYKEGVYAIPYEGEEVKLYWANQDQYYIKTTENFKDYTFFDNGRKVHFRLVDATTEQNNNKESTDKKRVFMLYEETPEKPELKTIEEIDGELYIRFIYDIPEDKKVKWAEENLKRISAPIVTDFKEWGSLMRNISSDPKKPKSVLEKHLEAYVAKNTFDYFIHKDLRGFLTRELDFYIKSEVIHLDDLDTTDEKRADSYLAKVRAIKRVGRIIIDFLVQIEDFQKKLWLKKKFVVSTDWCITLDQIDEAFYEEIIKNKEQIQEWVDMYAIDEIEKSETAEGFSAPLTVEFLIQNQNLVMDTKHFSTDFKDRLIESINNLDEQTNGFLIHSENFQALNFLKKKYDKRIKCIYIDPPYNTSASEILYKNNLKHSSWIAMMDGRVEASIPLLSDDGVLEVAIDDAEGYRLQSCLERLLGEHNHIANIAIMHNPKGREQAYVSDSHEYTYLYAKRKVAVGINRLPLTEEEIISKYPKLDSLGNYRELPLRRRGTDPYREDRPYMFFPFVINDNGDIDMLPNEEYSKIYDGITFNDDYILRLNKQYSRNAKRLIWPIREDKSLGRWRWGYQRCKEACKQNIFFLTGLTEETQTIYHKDYSNDTVLPKSLWFNNRYDASTKGTNLLKDIVPNNQFDYPKSIFAVEDFIRIGANKDSVILDYFAGSATTGHAVVNLNRQDNGTRKYVLVEMGEYFNSVTKPRIKKVVYSADWKSGKPQNRNTGISQIMKYIKLESYEDALSNIAFSDKKHTLMGLFGDDYLINYMLNVESEGSLLDIDSFKTPFSYKLKINENNETKEKVIDLCETFNYLLGLSVVQQSAVTYFKAEPDEDGTYEGAVRLTKNIDGEYAFKQIEGKLPDGRRALVIWRIVTDDLISSNAALDAYFEKHRINPRDRKFDVIYVNGDNNLENLKAEEELWKVNMIEPEFKQRMFEEA